MKSIGIDIGKRRCIVCTMDRNGTVLEETGRPGQNNPITSPPIIEKTS